MDCRASESLVFGEHKNKDPICGKMGILIVIKVRSQLRQQEKQGKILCEATREKIVDVSQIFHVIGLEKLKKWKETKGQNMDRLEKMASRVSESLIFGGFMDKTYESLKKRNFNCRRGTKIVDISHKGAQIKLH